MHLMRWQQLCPQIFRSSYPFPVHLKSIFVAGASWKVAQSKTKLTLLIYVRSEDDDPLRPTPLNIYLLFYLLRGLFPRFLSPRTYYHQRMGLKPNAKAQVFAPTIAPQNSNFSLSSKEKNYNFDISIITMKSTRVFKPRHAKGSFLPFHESF